MQSLPPGQAAGPLSFDDVEVELRDSATPTLTVMVCSWNVGNAPPNRDEMRNHWITPGPEIDIVVVGVQECSYKESGGHNQDFPSKVRPSDGTCYFSLMFFTYIHR